MAIKTIPVTISPVVAAARCSATCRSYYDGNIPAPSPNAHYDSTAYTNYQFTATAGQGWRFVRFDYVIRYTTNRGETSTQTLHLTTNPAPKVQSQDFYVDPFEYELIGDDGTIYCTLKEEIVSVTAVFFQLPTPTHLLVNSYSRSVPVKLVHDPSTHRLIAYY